MFPGSGQLFDQIALLFGVKALFVVGGVLYLLFAFVVIRQINIMGKTIRTVASGTIKLLGYAHFVAAALVLFYFVTAL